MQSSIAVSTVPWVASLAALAIAFACSSGSPASDGNGDPCKDALTCGSACSGDADCSSGLHCDPAGVCTAACTPGGGQCTGVTTCDARGRCVSGGGPIFEPHDGGFPPGSRGDACVKTEVGFEQLVPTVILLIDKSGSMRDDFDGEDRWNTLRATLIDPVTGVVPQVADRVRLGLTTYTSDDGDRGGACPQLIEIPPALNNAGRIATEYAAIEIANQEDDTPTADALAVVTEALDRIMDPGAKAIVLATDGEPDTCADPDAHNDATNALSVQAVTAAWDRGIATHVISVGDDVGQDHLEDLARAGSGGTGTPHRALNAQALVDAFEQIIRGVVTCDVRLNGTIQPGQEERGLVELDGTPLTFGDPDGWELLSSSSIRLLGDSCQRARLDANRLRIEFPCESFEPIR